MKLFNLLNARALLFGPALLLLASCGSYQYAGYEHDGIYTPENRETVTANDYDESYEEALYYKQLFAEKAEQFGNVPEEGAIFTDIDTYTSAGMYEDELFMQEDLDYRGGHAPWGDQVDEIAINFYNNSPFFYGGFMGPYYAGGFYDPFWMNRYGYGYGYGYGFGYNHWRYGYGYHNPWRWNRWGWNAGWAVHSPYYGYGNYNSYPHYSRKNVAYSNSRRSSYTDSNSNLRSNSQARSSRIQNYTNSRGVRAERSSAVVRSNRTSDDNNRTYSTRTSRVESPQSRSRNNSNSTYRSSNSRSSERSTQARSTRNTRSYDSSNQVRRSSSTSRSTPAVRSSSSSSRSSGTSSGSSRSSRGRGN